MIAVTVTNFTPEIRLMSSPTHAAEDLQQELLAGERSSLRYSMQLPVRLIVDGQEFTALTENLSASGALVSVSSLLPVGSSVQFFLDIPSDVIGSDITAAICGEGEVVRAFEKDQRNYAAIVINDYRFQ